MHSFDYTTQDRGYLFQLRIYCQNASRIPNLYDKHFPFSKSLSRSSFLRPVIIFNDSAKSMNMYISVAIILHSSRHPKAELSNHLLFQILYQSGQCTALHSDAKCPFIFRLGVWQAPVKVHIFWKGHKILRNLHQLFFLCTASQKIGVRPIK